MTTRTIEVRALARVEGEGALRLRYGPDGDVQDVELRIFEPPRLFEPLLRGRSFQEAPDLTSRICGICPVAYQLSACAALEDALGVDVPAPIAALRRLLYCGEWIGSHALHVVLLHAPDFVGVDDLTGLAQRHREHVLAGLAVKKAGNALLALLGGREIHPIAVRVGGFWGLPPRHAFENVRDELAAVRARAEALVRWTAGFDFPELTHEPVLVALQPGDVYPFTEGPIGTSTGLRFPPSAFEDHVVEAQVPYSTALQARLDGQVPLCGPLARFQLNFDRLPDPLRRLARDLGVEPPVRNPYRSIVVRGIEILFALDEAVRLLDGLVLPDPPAVPVTPRAGVGHGATEAPRGLLWHRYELAEDGTIVTADIVPPTSQNQLAMEADLRAVAPSLRPLDDDTARRRAEHVVRNHDPCISCSAHFLRLVREG